VGVIEEKANLRPRNELLGLIGFLGIGLSLIQYLGNRNLWLDEAMLAINFFERDFAGLLEPLVYDQVAPILFLWIEKALFEILPGPEYALRLFPLVLFWVSIFLFSKILPKFISERNFIYVGLLLFVINFNLIYYASEVKQYMGDVFSVLLILFLTLLDKPNATKIKYLTVIGPLLLFLSHITPFVLAGVFLYFLFSVNNSKEKKLFVILFIVWAIGFGFYYATFVYGHPAKSFMLTFWENSLGFMPLTWEFDKLYFFFGQKFILVTRYMLGLDAIGKYIFLVIISLGIYAFFVNKNEKVLLLLLLPLFIHLLFSGLKMYPLEARLFLYSIPVWILLMVKGLEYLQDLISLKNVRLSKFVVLLPIVSVFFAVISRVEAGFPTKGTEIKETYKLLESKRQNGEALFVTTSARPAYTFYQYAGTFKSEESNVYMGIFEEEIDRYGQNGRQFWVMHCHFGPEVEMQFGRIAKEKNLEILESYIKNDSCLFLIK
jgi:hypothetical protein